MKKTIMVALALLCAGWMAQAAGIQKILFLGNSITLHGPNKGIGWEGNWGMAASALDKDYVHLVAKGLSGPDGTKPKILVKNIASFERQYGTYDSTDLVKECAAFAPDLIVVAIGENVPALTNATQQTLFATKTAELLTAIRAERRPQIVVRSCFWANAAKDGALKTACQEVGGRYVDIGALGRDEANYARSEREYTHKGVAAHPGDRGMQAIADAIIKAVREDSPAKRP
ncbi:MAG: SGNH/GDSL hydrolase family protein [Kiritimatiellae bacterium]|jgi:hypothetical protein|nr:SGNH/GDSL hydrolase family protein [Kiritimatiellia bacterium]MDD2348791.1 SGNH/GDSL hydrolase family protein [Kiritimatiellia bacterium]MDD3583291.1 SGNH/GDSL hydrolase family protein [Kiritimatiellia bacterium]HHU14914.1 SGNH/GDSL hydrolase family protein [Lentisphaerota bacterium]